MKGVETKRKGARKKKEGDIKMGKDYKSYRLVDGEYGWIIKDIKNWLGGYLKGGIKY